MTSLSNVEYVVGEDVSKGGEVVGIYVHVPGRRMEAKRCSFINGSPALLWDAERSLETAARIIPKGRDGGRGIGGGGGLAVVSSDVS